MILNMKRHILIRALTISIAASALTLTSCSTTENRISDHPEIFNTLSPGDQALVREGKIRAGMSENAVWLAWGPPTRKWNGAMRGRSTETWVYTTYETAGGAGYGYGYGYGRPYFGGVGVLRHHGHHRFFFYGDPFYDPFYYSAIPPSVEVPYKVVSFANGRVLSWQFRTDGSR
jgi:hypothetical protein